MDERELEQLCSTLQERLGASLGELLRAAVEDAIVRALSASVVPIHSTDGGKEGEIRHLVRLCDQLGVIRDQLESRAGRRQRQRRRWRTEINTVTRLMQTNLDRLRQLGVTAMPYPERVDYSMHEPVHVYQTGDPLEDGRVVDVCRSGFLRDGRPWRLMQVAVLAYRPAPQKQTPTEKEN